jgi:hypothetical protein
MEQNSKRPWEEPIILKTGEKKKKDEKYLFGASEKDWALGEFFLV